MRFLIVVILVLALFLGVYSQTIPVCNMQYGFSVNGNGATICVKDGSGVSRNASEVNY